ncbi:platelet glycoprotein Ib alpha chain-like [Epinephelus moara]|uniref:platelet glycoprotein Ib alpha chain-like n=1 Tax=Epinephelus moara TaxID=300413 RepID=UPI00214F4680|nr:platelet glycoprotein Ib alpha chain-like [Epinephelus moara]
MQLFLTLLFLLSSYVATVTAWAGCTRDRDKDHRTRENCTALGFSDVPAGFEPTTKVMLFTNNLFSSLSWSSFQIFTAIYEIDFSGNKIPQVTSSVTPILPTLSVLRLGSNRLTSLSDGSFTACPALTELYLDNNVVDSLSDHTFSGLSKLEILDLSSNRIKVLPELMLHPLPAIETLYLESNKIMVMPDDWFSKKEEVPYLFLSANPWACSCSLGYLRRYLDDYEFNVYTRDGPIIQSDPESVVCDSPQWLKDKPVVTLEESDLCSPAPEPNPAGDSDKQTIPVHTDTVAPAVPDTTPLIPMTLPPVPTTVPPVPTTVPPVPTTVPPVPTTIPPVPIPFPIPTSTAAVPLNVSHTLAPHPTVRPPTERPADTTPTKPRFVFSTVKSTTPKLQVVPTTSLTVATITSTPSWAINEGAGGRIGAVGGAGVFCFWLFAGCLLLCVASAAYILVTLVWLVNWYRKVYKPLSMALTRRGRGGEVVRLSTYSSRGGKELLGEGAGGGVIALYRSVLFANKEGGVATEREDGGKEGAGGNERLLVTLEPTGGRGGTMGEEEGERGGREEKGMYRKTLYRLLSKEEEIEGWRDVMEECRVSAESRGGRRQGEAGSGGEVSRKRYSVILREEREEREEAGGGKEELDWVVGGWEVKRGEEEGEPRSSWGEWLAHYLPSMPWSVTTPPEGEAAQ